MYILSCVRNFHYLTDGSYVLTFTSRTNRVQSRAADKMRIGDNRRLRIPVDFPRVLIQ
jgi:hypothetical protein